MSGPSNESFLKIEQQCEEYVTGFLKSTVTITAGTQPLIAYLLLKELEIRTVRLIGDSHGTPDPHGQEKPLGYKGNPRPNRVKRST